MLGGVYIKKLDFHDFSSIIIPQNLLINKEFESNLEPKFQNVLEFVMSTYCAEDFLLSDGPKNPWIWLTNQNLFLEYSISFFFDDI